MDKKHKNSGKFNTNTNYTQKQENSVNRRLKRTDQQAFYSGGNTNVTTPTNNTFSESGPPSRETNPSFSASTRLPNSFNRDKKPPIATSNMQLPPNMPPNLENMPPRFQKKWLMDNNLPLDYLEKLVASGNQYGSQNSNSMPAYNRSQTLPKGNGNRAQNRGNFYTPGASNTSSGYSNQSGKSPLRSRSRSSDQRGSRHSSRNSSLERGSVQSRLYQSNSDRRYGARSPDFFKRNDNKNNYGQNKGWIKSSYYSKSEDASRDTSDIGLKGKESAILDWSLEVEEDEKRKWNDNHYHSRRSNRSHSRSNMDRPNNNQPHPQQSSDKSFNVAYDHFKVPYSRGSRSRKNSQSSTLSRENSTDRSYPNRFSSSRENSTERYQTQRDPTNWRAPARLHNEMQQQQQQKVTNADTKIAEMTKQFVDAVDLKKGPGVLVLPSSAQLVKEIEQKRLMNGGDEMNGKKEYSEAAIVQKKLFDPKHPEKPIVVNKTGRVPAGQSDSLLDYKNDLKRKNRASLCEAPTISSHPLWYDSNTDQYRSAYNSHLIDELRAVDMEIQEIVDSKELFRVSQKWTKYNETRHNGQKLLIEFLKSDLKFCETENVEQHCWKLLFYNIIELLRRPLSEIIDDDDSKKFYKTKALEIIEPGLKYWEQVMAVLEEKYKFKLDEFVGANASARIYSRNVDERKFIKLALVSLQKVLIYLGDLSRYKELINETNNYGRAKQYYTKAQQVLPKNGRPYNQLALLSVYSKRKIDAVYFYMRSLMSSNPFQSAREALIALFDETRKKYENNQKRRDEKNRLRLKEKEHRFDGGHLRRETWIHPEENGRVHRRFAPLDPLIGHNTESTDEDELNQLDALEVNKRFITSFLHILGKLITKIGMESFVQCAIQMLREFRALIQHSPIAITCQRLLQLIGLNMFAIDCSQLKDPNIAGGARSEVHESAIIIGLLMFSIILERFLCVLKEALNVQQKTSQQQQTADETNRQQQQQESNLNTSDIQNMKQENNNKKQKLILPEDAKVMLPAIKVWCEWMTQQQNIWNPPPCFTDYKITSDPWTGLASLLTLLENVNIYSKKTCDEAKADYELVKLQEDFLFTGFTPLLGKIYEPVYTSHTEDMDLVENELRLRKILNFGNDVLCSCVPPILEKRTLADGTTEYVSVVQYQTEEPNDSEILLECISDEEKEENIASELLPSTILLKALTKNNKSLDNSNSNNTSDDTDEKTKNNLDSDEKNSANNNDNAAEIRRLLRRKDELLRKQRMQEKYNQRLQEILSQSTVALTIEIRPRYLVPDTNCFVDHLDMLKAITSAYPLYQLMVPLVVINELEGLSKGNKPSQNVSTSSQHTVTQIGIVPITTNILNITSNSRLDNEHALKVAEASKAALIFLKSKPVAVKLVTTKGHQIKTFIASEDDSTDQRSNDNKILDTALNLCKPQTEERIGDTRHIVRDVVLITKDRNLRVKALSNDLPVRELPDFIKWAGLGS